MSTNMLPRREIILIAVIFTAILLTIAIFHASRSEEQEVNSTTESPLAIKDAIAKPLPPQAAQPGNAQSTAAPPSSAPTESAWFTAAELSPKTQVPTLVDVVSDLNQAIQQAKSGNTAWMLGLYQWQLYCDSQHESNDAQSLVEAGCPATIMSREAKLDFVLSMLRNREYRAVDHLIRIAFEQKNSPTSTSDAASITRKSLLALNQLVHFDVREAAMAMSVAHLRGQIVPRDDVLAYALVLSCCKTEAEDARYTQIAKQVRQGDKIRISQILEEYRSKRDPEF